MNPRLVRVVGLAGVTLYAGLIVWIYAQQPGTMAEIAGGLGSTIGAYRVDEISFREGLRFFRNEQFPEARAAFERADPGRRDPITQFYIAYGFYRQGWGRTYSDDVLFRQGIEVVGRAIERSEDGRVVVEDPDLGMHTADELKAELERGITREVSDLNPLKIFRPRK